MILYINAGIRKVIYSESRSVFAWGWVEEVEGITKRHRKLLEVMFVLTILIVAIISWLRTCVKCIKYTYFTVCQFCLSKSTHVFASLF